MKYHSPSAWPKRFSAQIGKNRAGYSDGSKKFLSFLWKGSKILYSLPPLLMSLILFFMAYVKFGEENFWFILGGACLCLLLFFWFLPKNNENPFKNQ